MTKLDDYRVEVVGVPFVVFPDNEFPGVFEHRCKISGLEDGPTGERRHYDDETGAYLGPCVAHLTISD